MKAFGRLYQRLDSTTSINLKVEALVQYFQETPPPTAWQTPAKNGDFKNAS